MIKHYIAKAFIAIFFAGIFALAEAAAAQECIEPQLCGITCDGLPSGYISGGNPNNFKYEDCLTSCSNTYQAAYEQYTTCTITKQQTEQLQAQEQARLRAEEEARSQAEEEARLQTEEEARQKTQQDAQNQKIEDQTAKKSREVSFSELAPGETIKAGPNETITVRFEDGSRVELDSGGSFKRISADEITGLKGKANFFFEKLLNGRRFRIGSSTAVTSVRGTEFRIEATKNKTVIRVTEGTVEVSGPKKKKKVALMAGYEITVTKKKLGKPKMMLE